MLQGIVSPSGQRLVQLSTAVPVAMLEQVPSAPAGFVRLCVGEGDDTLLDCTAIWQFSASSLNSTLGLKGSWRHFIPSCASSRYVVQIGAAGLAEIAQFADSRSRSMGSKAAMWGQTASQMVRKTSSGKNPCT